MSEQESKAREHWQQYLWAEAEANLEIERLEIKEIDYKQYLPEDPTHPRAWIPAFVRYAKRKQVNFICPITGWKENDWYRGLGGGPFRKVGMLTMDHIIPGAAGGLTIDDNIRAVCYLANSKKGHKQITDQDLRRQILNSYRLVDMPIDLLEVVNKYGITQYKVGN